MQGGEVLKKFDAGDDLPVDQVGTLLRHDALHKVELDEEKQANITRFFDRLGQPVVKQVTPGCGDVKDPARRASALRFYLRLNILQAFEFFEVRIPLAHFQVDDLAQRATFELLEHLVCRLLLEKKKRQHGEFGCLANQHTLR